VSAAATPRRVVAVHQSSGRERLKIAGLYRNAAMKEALEARLAARAGIVSVEANIFTGNVLVCYEACRYSRGVLTAVRRTLAHLDGAAAGNGGAETPWHQLEAHTVLSRLGVERSRGLSKRAAKARRAGCGANVLPASQKRSPAAIFAAQFRSLPVALLGGSAALTLATGGMADAVVIGAVVLINAAIGFFTERGTDRVIHGLGRVAPGRARLLRDGEPVELDPADVAPGDVLILAPGVAIAADARIVEAREPSVDESALTGESLPVAKSAAPVPAGSPLAERTGMVYRATTVTGGSGLAVAVATGRGTEVGRIQALLGETGTPDTPLQKQLAVLGRRLVAASAPACAATFVLGLLRGRGVLPMLKSSVALFVAAIPEGLSAVATTLLALGVRELRANNILVRRLNAVEALGAVQTLCLDKTGTLTLNRMKVVEVATAGRHFAIGDGGLDAAGEELRRLMSLAVLCSDARIERLNGIATLSGSATEGALLDLARGGRLDIDALRRLRPKLESAYRAEGRPYMATLHAAGAARLVAVKGSPADVLALCDSRCVDGVAVALTPAERERILERNAAMAGRGLRVLGFAYRELADGEPWNGAAPAHLVWVGLAAIADSLRPGAAEVVATLRRAGISTAMITGDQVRTAAAIGRQIGVADVYARVSPSEKLKIVQALQRAGRVVAMTGDGINDGPALRSADVGVAMGRSGTEVARSVADIVLENDELASIPVAVRHGRARMRTCVSPSITCWPRT
jgi:Ca2+-transporting ATPase